MTARSERLTDVARKRPYIRALAAHHPYRDALPTIFCQLYLVDHQSFCLKIHRLTLTSLLVCPLAVDLAGRILRRYLLYPPFESLQNLFHKFTGNMFHRKPGINLRFEVKRRRGRTKRYRRHILLHTALELLYELRCLAGDHYHHPRSQRIQRPGVSHLKTLHPQTTQHSATQTLHHIETGPAKRLVDGKYLPLDKIFFRADIHLLHDYHHSMHTRPIATQ